MKKCAIISFYGKNEYRKNLVRNIISYFNKRDIDVILASSDHIEKFDGVRNYITASNVVSNRYMSENLYKSYEAIGRKFLVGMTYNAKINQTNYFVKLHQTVTSYAKLLGYDYYYFLDFDAIIRENYFDIITSNDWDYSKFYVYDFRKYTLQDEYMVGFLHGNLEIANQIWSQQNLDTAEELCKTKTIYGPEGVLYEICQKYKEHISYNKFNVKTAFIKYNTISSANSAHIYYDRTNNSYIFLQYKGEAEYDTSFSVELYMENELIYSNHISTNYVWHVIPLQNYKNYTIKTYDGEISNDTFCKVVDMYTDPNDTKCHINWVE